MFDHALFKARALAEEYESFAQADDLRKCEKRFLWTCSAFINKNIEVLYLPASIAGTAMPGTFIRLSDGGYKILLSPNLTPEWKRFVLCKELFHVVMDDEKVWNLDLASHLDQTLFAKSTNGTPLSTLSEYAAFAAAAEFLFPHSKRTWLVSIGRQADIAGVARQFDIPGEIVDYFMAPGPLKQYCPPSY